MKQLATGLTLILIFSFSVKTFAQYPEIPENVQRKADELMKAAVEHSDKAWEKALPIIEKEAAEGKPYIPWAKRPYRFTTS